MDCIENDVSNYHSTLPCAFVVAVMFLPSRCLATIGDPFIDTALQDRFIKYAVQMGSGAMYTN
jgi:hypothetical protein